MKKKFYITTSIAYANAPPHVGFALELIQADVVARYRRLLGEDVFFLTGTDEHGAKIVRAAEEAGKTPKKFTDDISKKFENLTKVLNLANNDFIRTTDQKRHWPTVQQVWLKLKENGDIYKKKYKGLYCVGCEAFVKEKDLIDGKCPIHQKELELVEEENYFFKLSKYSSRIKEIIKKNEVEIIPGTRKNEMLSFISQGLEDVSFSRSREKLNWGIPVPGDDSHVIYVWADALVNYISALGGLGSDKFKEYWPPYVHFLGKDILRFHATIWLGILLSLDLELPQKIFVHGFITSNSQKMSKSLGNVVDPFGLVKKYGVDAVRYFLLREIPPTEDGDFTYEKFEARYDADLASGLGNLVSRVITLAEKSGIKEGELQRQNWVEFDTVLNSERRLQKALNSFKFNEAITVIWELIGWCDHYIEIQKAWENPKEQPVTIHNLLFVLFHISRMLRPFLPNTSDEIFKQLGIKPTDKKWKLNIKKGKPLFPRI